MANDLLELRLDALAFGGDAVGRDDSGRVVFVPGGAPGDLVEARVTERKKAYARGELMRVVEPGARVTPACPLASTCGGCPWMHVESATQLGAKEEIVRRALAKSGAQVERILPSPSWLGYRTRVRMTARSGAVGFQARKSHRVVDVPECPALEPRLDRAVQAARAAIGPLLGDGGTLSGLLAADGRVHLAVTTCGERGTPETLADAAAGLVGESQIVGVSVRSNDGKTSRYYGQPRLDVGEGFAASAAGFAQANAAQNQILRKLVLRWAVPDEAAEPRVLELYAGDGNFTRDLVKRARVVAVEGDREAAARLVDNLRVVAPRTTPSDRGGSRTPVDTERWAVRAEPSAQAVRRLLEGAEQFDVVVLDPPRAGAPDLVDELPALGATRIVYISCDPMTLARDVARLAPHYRVVRAQPLDMMPHTSHIEVLCLLQRA